MPLVFSVFNFFFFFGLLVCTSRAVFLFNTLSNLSKWTGYLADWSKSGRVTRLLVCNSGRSQSRLQMLLIGSDCSILVILRDTVGLRRRRWQQRQVSLLCMCFFFFLAAMNHDSLARGALSFLCSFLDPAAIQLEEMETLSARNENITFTILAGLSWFSSRSASFKLF